MVFWYLFWLHHMQETEKKSWKMFLCTLYACIRRERWRETATATARMRKIKHYIKSSNQNIICWCIYDSGARSLFFHFETMRILRPRCHKVESCLPFAVWSAHSVGFLFSYFYFGFLFLVFSFVLSKLMEEAIFFVHAVIFPLVNSIRMWDVLWWCI